MAAWTGRDSGLAGVWQCDGYRRPALAWPSLPTLPLTGTVLHTVTLRSRAAPLGAHCGLEWKAEPQLTITCALMPSSGS